MAPSDCSEMPWTSCPTHIKGRILEATATFRLGGLRVAIRERMPVVEDHGVRYEVVAAVEDVWIEKSDEEDVDVVGDGSDQFVAEEKLGAMIENLLVTLPVLPNPRFLVRVATQEAAENKSLPISGENSPPRHGCLSTSLGSRCSFFRVRLWRTTLKTRPVWGWLRENRLPCFIVFSNVAFPACSKMRYALAAFDIFGCACMSFLSIL